MDGIASLLRRHDVIGLDTSVFIYHIEGTSPFATAAGIAMEALERGVFAGVTSVLTLMEIAVKPLQLGLTDAANEYEIILAHFPNLAIAPIDRATARRAAELRAAYRLRPADALHIAACIQFGATAFLTNDRRLRRITEVQILLLEDCVSE